MRIKIISRIFAPLAMLVLLFNACPASAMAAPQPSLDVKAEVVNCSMEQGWCSSQPKLRIVAQSVGLTVKTIDGIFNGAVIHVEGDNTSLDLIGGKNSLVFWATSTSGLKSLKRYLSFRLEAKNIYSGFQYLDKEINKQTNPGRDMLSAENPSVTNGQMTAENPPAFFKIADGMNLASLPASISNFPQYMLTQIPDKSRVTSYLFGVIFGRKDVVKNTAFISENVVSYYSMIVDDTPPVLSILPQDSYSGKLTFSGEVGDDISGLKTLLAKINGDWQPLDWKNNSWKYVWNTEKEQITGGAFTIDLKAQDLSGNQNSRSLDFMVINRIWPIPTLCAFFFALGILAVLDPRRKAWKKMSLMVSRMVSLNLVNLSEEDK